MRRSPTETQRVVAANASYFPVSADVQTVPEPPSNLGRVHYATAAVAFLGLVARFAMLGSRPAHFDEARVAFWTLQFFETGQFHYRFIIHGPLVQHLLQPVFAVLGPTDAAIRTPVALAGGLLPLVALWVRHRLDDVEVVALAAFLAFNPVLLYYGRFFRSSVLVAAFCFLAFAAFVRLYDGFGVRYLYAGTGALALGFAAKENAILYVLCWVGAAALLVDAKLFRPSGSGSGLDLTRAWVGGVADRLRDPGSRRRVVGWVGHLLVAAFLFAAVFVFFYAPRGGQWVGLYEALGSPDKLPAMLQTTEEHVTQGYCYWFGGGGETTLQTAVDRLGFFAEVISRYAAPLVGLAVVGTLAERYGSESPRSFVLGCAYWGFVSIPGYALGTDITNAWVLVNALVPLAVPAAVGLGLLVETGRNALASEQRARAGGVALALVLLSGAVLSGAVTGVYAQPTSPENELVQFTQPNQEMRPAVDRLVEASARNDGTDVLMYGERDGEFVDMKQSAPRTPACANWFNTLPLPWYTESNDAAVECGATPESLPEELPPVVVVPAECTLDRAVECRDRPRHLHPPRAVAERTAEYERFAFLHRTTGGNSFDGMIIYVDRSA